MCTVQGFNESSKHIQMYAQYNTSRYNIIMIYPCFKDDNVVSGFLDRTLTSRLGIRMLVHHHLLLQDARVGRAADSFPTIVNVIICWRSRTEN